MGKTLSIMSILITCLMIADCGGSLMGFPDPPPRQDRGNLVQAIRPDEPEEVVRKVYETGMIYQAEAYLTPEQYKQYPLLQNHCRIGKVHLFSNNFPMTVSHSEQTIFMTSTVIDEDLFGQYAKEVTDWWKVRKTEKAEHQGFQLFQKAQAAKAITYEDIVKAIFAFYDKRFDVRGFTVVCNNMPKWVVEAFPLDWDEDRVIEKTPVYKKDDEKKELPKKRRTRRNRARRGGKKQD